jgi:hypothetical protein
MFWQMNESKERVVIPSCVNQVTAEHIDKTLRGIASNTTYSSTAFKESIDFDTIGELSRIYRLLRYREAKWLTRLILGDFGSVKFPDELDCGPNQRSLPRCVFVKAKFQVSIPESERRDGPGLMRLGAAGKACENLPLTPPTTAPEPASATLAANIFRPLRLATNTPARLAPPEGCHTPPVTALEPASTLRHQRVASKSPTRITPLHECPTPRQTVLETTSSAFTPTTNCCRQTLANNSPNRITPLGERRDVINHQSPSLRRTPGRQTPVQGKITGTPSRKPPRTMNGTPSKQQNSNMSSPSCGSRRGRCVQSPSASPLSVYGSGKCQLTETTCPLANCIFLLAPCIAKLPWITDNLLKWHGSRYVLSAEAFSHPNFPRRCPETGKLYRKVILAEPHRMEQTVEFLRKFGRLLRQRTKGQKQTTEVYDWRVLESIAKVDRGKELGKKSWSKYRMCGV